MPRAAPALDILNQRMVEIKPSARVSIANPLLSASTDLITTLQSGISSPSSAIEVAN